MFPSQIENVLAMVDGATSEYRIVLGYDDESHRDVLYITVEVDYRVDFKETADKITKLIKSKIGVSPKIAIVPIGTLPRSEKKTKRVEDTRPCSDCN